MTSKIFLGVVSVAAVLGAVAFFGYSPFLKLVVQQFGSPAGTTLGTAKIASEVINVSTTTQFAILNTDTSTRVITSAEVWLIGGAATGSAPTIKCATSSTNTLGGQSVTNLVLSASPFSFGTTTGDNAIYIASSSPGIIGTTTVAQVQQGPNTWARQWASGSYLTCSLTASDNTANVMDSGMSGTITFKYLGQ